MYLKIIIFCHKRDRFNGCYTKLFPFCSYIFVSSHKRYRFKCRHIQSFQFCTCIFNMYKSCHKSGRFNLIISILHLYLWLRTLTKVAGSTQSFPFYTCLFASCHKSDWFNPIISILHLFLWLLLQTWQFQPNHFHSAPVSLTPVTKVIGSTQSFPFCTCIFNSCHKSDRFNPIISMQLYLWLLSQFFEWQVQPNHFHSDTRIFDSCQPNHFHSTPD